MARLLKTENLSREGYGFAYKIHKRPCKLSPSIGFEFEIPLDGDYLVEKGYIDYAEDCVDIDYFDDDPAEGFAETKFSYDWLNRRGFMAHYECGGFEVGSPVHYNVAQARATARALIAELDDVPWLSPDQEGGGYVDCGIHVHASIPEMSSEYANHLCELAFLIMNRSDSAEWLWAISGRNERQSYASQAKATRWDLDTIRHDTTYHNSSIFRNCPGSTSTLEYRLFTGVRGRLLPAIDLAHSMTKFVDNFARKNERLLEEVSVPGYYSPTFLSSNVDVPALREVIPTIKQFKEWLGKQPGYHDLKNDPAMALI
jgi:hypothetical protein